MTDLRYGVLWRQRTGIVHRRRARARERQAGAFEEAFTGAGKGNGNGKGKGIFATSQMILIERPMMRASASSEMTDWTIISSLARRVRGMVSAGLSAVAVQNARKR